MEIISSEIKEKLLDLPIVDVVKDYVKLQKSGVNYVGLCPFHNEKSPSFTVSPLKNICHCFSCGNGGNTISFVMKMESCDYPSACKILGQKFSIDIPEQELTPEEEALQRKRESGFVIFEKIQQHFSESLHADSDKAKAMYEYAVNRWGEEIVSEYGIGYAPGDAADLPNFVSQSGLDVTLAKELGLIRVSGKDSQYYGFYRDRLTIPIRDRFGRIVGYTARTIDPNVEKKNKYINGTDSYLFSKKDILFGLDSAIRSGSHKKMFYMVEGAADVLRLRKIGINNVVGTLGTALTNDHLRLLKRYNCALCMIPDQDGPGIDAVVKNGTTALKEGFKVKVKEIPLNVDDNGVSHKQDADSFFHTIDDFESLSEEDFVLWYAHKQFLKVQTPDEKRAFLNEIASLLVLLNDTDAAIYINELTKYIPGKRIWRKEMKSLRAESHNRIQKSTVVGTSDTNKELGFFVRNNMYCTINDKGGTEEWSNFTLTPLFHIRDIIMAKRIYLIKNVQGVEELIEFNQEDLVSLPKFKIKVEGLGNYIWKAGDKELTKLKDYLYSKTETAIQIRKLGWQDDGFYAFGNGVYHDGTWTEANEHGIVKQATGNFYLPAASRIYKKEKMKFTFERNFVHLGKSTVSLQDFLNLFFEVFGDNGRIGFLFLLASLYRDVIFECTSEFPILNLFGPKGSGKSRMAETLMLFFQKTPKKPNLSNSTVPALNETFAALSGGLVMVEEYKNELSFEKLELLKGTYDGTGRTRVNMRDPDKQKEVTSVDCGIIMTGQEMPTADTALFSRTIFLQYKRTVFSEEEEKKMNQLLRMRENGLTHLTLAFLDFRSIIEKCFVESYQEVMNEINTKLAGALIEPRSKKNWAIPLAVYKILENKIQTDLSYHQVLNIAIEGIRIQDLYCHTTSDVGNFWKIVQYMFQEGVLIEGGDFSIKVDTKKTGSPIEVLYLQRTRISLLYLEYSNKLRMKTIPEETMRFYLEQSAAYIGEKVCNYKMYVKGTERYTRPEDCREARPLRLAVRSFVFDYSMLVKEFQINLKPEEETKNYF